ncbi:acyl-CoA N-acyltransferase [Xylariaceae sp. FL1272]|nr:acyl-CoA N-acyltransferase [Xylariaceae sp. FL1272]
MSLKLQEIDPNADFPALARCILESYETPLQTFIYLFFPPFSGSRAVTREEALEEVAARLKSWHTSDPSSRWQKVVDTDTGSVVAGAAWNVYTENPFANDDTGHMDVTWYPPGGMRAYVETALESYGTPRYKAAQRPHLYLFNIFTHPDYRGQGIGQKIMEWGFRQADDLGLDIFLDATPVGKPLYDRNGFVSVEENVTDIAANGFDDQWDEMAETVGPFTFWLMLRRPAERQIAHEM